MDMALSNVDQQRFEIEKEAEKLQANELLKQFKVEMGMVTPQASDATSSKTIGGREGEKSL
jgi:phage shock protein A